MDKIIYHHETIKAHSSDVKVKVEINVSAIARVLGNKAVYSSGGKSVEIGGLVTVKVVK